MYVATSSQVVTDIDLACADERGGPAPNRVDESGLTAGRAGYRSMHGDAHRR
jgi:hypothetical protein